MQRITLPRHKVSVKRHLAAVDERIRRTVERVYDLLVQREYGRLEKLTGGVRLSAKEIEDAVKDYPHALQSRPVGAPIDVVEITNSSPRAWSIRADAYLACRAGRPPCPLECQEVLSR
jgi:hypothetical protein